MSTPCVHDDGRRKGQNVDKSLDCVTATIISPEHDNMTLLSTLFILIHFLQVDAWLPVLCKRGIPVDHESVTLRDSSCRRKLRLFSSSGETTSSSSVMEVVDRSTITLLEHINLNIPTHDHALPFYLEVLGCGLDPRKATNIGSPKKTIWANCGASQFHLPYGETPQTLRGHMGLRFQSLQGLEERLEANRETYVTAQKCIDPSGQENIRIIDHYGNIFVCRAKSKKQSQMRQPILHPNQTEEWGDVATRYGRTESDCQGIDYVEFSCPMGSAEKIALFYESVLDATTSTIRDPNGMAIAIIAVGDVDDSGRAEQSLLFRETTDPIPDYDGHHIALYVGESSADFEQAFKNALLANVVWCNPRFQDQVDSIAELRKEHQFRFKDIVDMQTGERIMELEHELRSIDHKAWPGRAMQV